MGKTSGSVNLIISIAGIACAITYCFGYIKGKSEFYKITRPAAIKAYEARIADLEKQIEISSENYAILQKKQASEIAGLTKKYNQEIIKTQEISFIKGQTDIRDNYQKQIDSRAQQNMEKGDWNAPVYGTRKK